MGNPPLQAAYLTCQKIISKTHTDMDYPEKFLGNPIKHRKILIRWKRIVNLRKERPE
jgi:hypothetical protein